MKKPTKRLVLALIAVVCLVILLTTTLFTGACAKPAPTTPAPTPAQPIKLIFSFFEPPASANWTAFCKPWFDEVMQKSGGKVVIEPHLGGELVSLVDTYDAVLKGTIDIGFYFPMMNAEKFLLQDITSFFSSDVYVAKKGRLVYDLYKAFPEMQKEFSDTHLLWYGVSHSCALATVKKPIRKLEDAKGLKFTTTGKWNAAREQAVGLVPVSLPPEQTVPALQSGLLDGMGILALGLRDLSWGPALKYVTMVEMTQAAYSIVINLNKWNALPADIQKIFTDTAEAWVDKFDTTMVNISQERLASAPQEFGIEIITFSKDELARWAAASKPVTDAYAAELDSKGLPGTKLISELHKLEQKYAVPNNPYLK